MPDPNRLEKRLNLKNPLQNDRKAILQHKNTPLKFALLIFLAFICMVSLAFSQEKKSGDTKKKKEPIEITSEKMRSENKGEKIIFTGNVLSLMDDIEIKSDVLEVYNTNTVEGEDKSEEGGMDQIIAIGNVVITRGLKKAKGDKAVYFDKEQKIILTSATKVIAWEDKDIIEGKEMVFLLDKDRFLVNDRVKVLFYQKEKSEKENSKKSSPKADRKK